MDNKQIYLYYIYIKISLYHDIIISISISSITINVNFVVFGCCSIDMSFLSSSCAPWFWRYNGWFQGLTDPECDKSQNKQRRVSKCGCFHVHSPPRRKDLMGSESHWQPCPSYLACNTWAKPGRAAKCKHRLYSYDDPISVAPQSDKSSTCCYWCRWSYLATTNLQYPFCNLHLPMQESCMWIHLLQPVSCFRLPSRLACLATIGAPDLNHSLPGTAPS